MKYNDFHMQVDPDLARQVVVKLYHQVLYHSQPTQITT
jgi:hypothetical protein